VAKQGDGSMERRPVHPGPTSVNFLDAWNSSWRTVDRVVT
jgi:hypothetical protein